MIFLSCRGFFATYVSPTSLFPPLLLYFSILISISKTWADERVKIASRWASSVFPLGTQTVLRRRNDELPEVDRSRNATKRQREFAAGRSCAAALLNRWDVAEEVGVADDRSPVWPDGFVGSISHSDRWVWAAVAQSAERPSIGIDTESVVCPATHDMLLDDIVTAAERSIVESLDLSPEVAFTLAFSAKEAFYKCWYPITRSFFEFKQVAIESCSSDTLRIVCLESNPNFKISPAKLDVHFLATDSDVFTATWMEHKA